MMARPKKAEAAHETGGDTQSVEQTATSVAGTVPVRLKYDTWFKADERTTAGTVVSVDIETAKRLIADDKAERADPLPGDPA